MLKYDFIWSIENGFTGRLKNFTLFWCRLMDSLDCKTLHYHQQRNLLGKGFAAGVCWS